MIIKHKTFNDAFGHHVRASTEIDGKQYGCEVSLRQFGIVEATQRAESNLLQYLERNNIHARNPGEEANG
jgi:hypothetical protein